MVFVFLFLIYFTQYVISTSISVLQMALFHSFSWLSNSPLLHTHTSLSIHLSMDIYHLGCFHVLAIIKKCCYEHRAACISLNYSFVLIYTQEWDCWLIWQLYFQFFEESPYCFPQWLHQFTFLPTVQEGSLFSIPSPAFIICRLFNDGHSDQYEVVSHCSFDLYFSNNQQS